MAVDDGARNVAEDPARFVYNSRGAKIIAGRDAEASAVDVLHRHAAEHTRQQTEAQRATWRGRRAA